MAGKTAIVTSADIGLGLETAHQLLDLSLSELVLAVTRRRVRQPNRICWLEMTQKPEIEFWKLDLTSYKSILAFAGRAKALDKLHIAIQNAGVSKTSFSVTQETGHEEKIQVNYFLLHSLRFYSSPSPKRRTPQISQVAFPLLLLIRLPGQGSK